MGGISLLPARVVAPRRGRGIVAAWLMLNEILSQYSEQTPPHSRLANEVAEADRL